LAKKEKDFLAKMIEFLPEAIHPYVSFEGWDYYYDQLHITTCMIRVPGLAPIRILCTFDENWQTNEILTADFLNIRGCNPFQVIKYAAVNVEGEYIVSEFGWVEYDSDDINLALYYARSIGETYNDAQAEANRKNAELAAQPKKPEPEPLPSPEQQFFDMFKMLIHAIVAEEIREFRDEYSL